MEGKRANANVSDMLAVVISLFAMRITYVTDFLYWYQLNCLYDNYAFQKISLRVDHRNSSASIVQRISQLWHQYLDIWEAAP